MSWRNLLKPTLVLSGSILSLPPHRLKDYGIKGLILDVDHTLVPSHSCQIPPDLKAWVEAVQTTSPLWLVTNNPNRSRIEAVANQLGLPFLLSAGKPSRKKLQIAADEMGIPVASVAMVGDRLFTDILAGNRLGMTTILVKPIAESGGVSAYNLIHLLEFQISRMLGVPVI